MQKVRRRRLCMNTPPSGGGNVCPGPLLSVVTMKCTGGRCRTSKTGLFIGRFHRLCGETTAKSVVQIMW